MGQKIANAPLGSFQVKTIFDDMGNAIQEASIASILTIRVDEGTTYNYYGWAQPGTSNSDPEWRIARWTVANPNALMWADGDTYFDNIWNNRLALIYI